MPSVNQHLDYAERAVKYVESVLRGGAANKPEDIIHQLQRQHGPRVVAQLAREKPGDFVKLFYAQEEKQWQQIEAMRSRYVGFFRPNNLNTVLSYGVGNCDEHALLAAGYLDHLGLSQTSSVTIVCTEEPQRLAHTWVMLGLPDTFSGDVKVSLRDPGTLGPETVVCDAWYHEWFSVQRDWKRKMGSILWTTNRDKAQPLPEDAIFHFIPWPMPWMVTQMPPMLSHGMAY